MKGWGTLLLIVVLFVAGCGFLWMFETRVAGPERAACQAKGGTYFEGRGGYFCLRQDVVIPLRR